MDHDSILYGQHPGPEIQDGLTVIDEPILELGNFEDDYRELVTPPEILLAYEKILAAPATGRACDLSGLSNVVWDDLEALHPMLDFSDTTAYVAVSLDFDAPPHITSLPYIVGSDGSFFMARDLSALRQRSLRHSRTIAAVPGRWKKSYFREFLEGRTTHDPARMFWDIRAQIERYVRFEERSTYSFMTLWTIGTYLHPLFDAFPMVLLCGPKNSGKTRTLQVASLLAFNARLQGDPTPATVFRIIDEERPTLIFDEMEWLSRRDMQSQLSSILKFGYKPGCKVPRCAFDARGNAFVVDFDAYCPKLFANIHGLEDVLGDRAITFYQRRKTAEDRIETASPSEDDPVWARLRHELYVFTLTHWQTVRELVPTGDLPIENRIRELFTGVLALARFFEDHAGIAGLYDEMLTLASEKAAEKRETDREFNHETILIQALVSIVTQDGWYPLSDVIRELQNFFTDRTDWISDVWVGRALLRIGIGKAEGTRQRRWVHDGNLNRKYLTHCFITRREIETLARQYGVSYTPMSPMTEEDERIIDSW